MSQALPGERYCKEHQGNHSHYDPHNCTVCKLRRQVAELVETLEALRSYNHKTKQRYNGEYWSEVPTGAALLRVIERVDYVIAKNKGIR